MTDQCHSFRTGGKREARRPKPSPLAEPAAGVKQESTHSQLEPSESGWSDWQGIYAKLKFSISKVCRPVNRSNPHGAALLWSSHPELHQEDLRNEL